MTSLAYQTGPGFGRGSLPVTRLMLSPAETTRTSRIPDETDCLSSVTGDAGIGLPANDAEAGPATILLVEDDGCVLAVAADFLRNCGFHVLEATSTKEAKRALASAAAIDVLFSDICLPEESGFELASWCQRTRPHVRILLTSGFADRFYDVPAGGGCFSVLPKPYRLRELLARLEPLLPPGAKVPRLADARAGEERPSRVIAFEAAKRERFR